MKDEYENATENNAKLPSDAISFPLTPDHTYLSVFCTAVCGVP